MTHVEGRTTTSVNENSLCLQTEGKVKTWVRISNYRECNISGNRMRCMVLTNLCHNSPYNRHQVRTVYKTKWHNIIIVT